MLAVGLTDPDLVGWPGFDTLVRRVVLRRPEERLAEPIGYDATGRRLPPAPLRVPDRPRPDRRPLPLAATSAPRPAGPSTRTASPLDHPALTAATGRARTSPTYEVPVGEWLDSSALPSLSREKLEKASGIEIPGRGSSSR